MVEGYTFVQTKILFGIDRETDLFKSLNHSCSFPIPEWSQPKI